MAKEGGRDDDGIFVQTFRSNGGFVEYVQRDCGDSFEFTPHCKAFLIGPGVVIPASLGEVKHEGGIPLFFTSAPFKIPKPRDSIRVVGKVEADGDGKQLVKHIADPLIQFHVDYKKAYNRALEEYFRLERKGETSAAHGTVLSSDVVEDNDNMENVTETGSSSAVDEDVENETRSFSGYLGKDDINFFL